MSMGMEMDSTLKCDWGEARRRCLGLAVSILRSQHDAEEAVQEAFVRGWRNASSCRNRRDPVPWLMTITRRECVRLASRSRKREEVGIEACSERSDGRDTSEAVTSATDVRSAVARLPYEDRRLLDLHYARQLTYAEVAEAVSLPEGTVKTKLHRIRARLRTRLEVQWKT